MKNKQLKYAGLIVTAVLLFSCSGGKTEEAMTMEKIHKTDGIPVKVLDMEPESFTKTIPFNSTVKGIRESTGSALVSDAVEEILVKVGDYVQKGDTIVRFPESNPAANYYQAQAGFQAAEQAFKRVENLYKNNGVSRQKYDDAKTQYQVQQANWDNVQDLIRVTAPISGYITRINVSVSDNVHPGTELFTVSNYGELTTTVYADDDQIGEIKAGDKVSADWKDKKIEGKVTQVDLAKDPDKKAFAVKVTLENQGLAVPSGVACDLSIHTETVKDAFVLHRNSILKDDKGNYVLVAKDGYARRQAVVLGESEGMYYRILSGLSKGDQVIVEGTQLARIDGKVKVTGQAKTLVAIR